MVLTQWAAGLAGAAEGGAGGRRGAPPPPPAPPPRLWGGHGARQEGGDSTPRQRLASRAGRRAAATCITADAKTSTNAPRSSTSLMVCAKRKTVQSRWYVM